MIIHNCFVIYLPHKFIIIALLLLCLIRSQHFRRKYNISLIPASQLKSMPQTSVYYFLMSRMINIHLIHLIFTIFNNFVIGND